LTVLTDKLVELRSTGQPRAAVVGYFEFLPSLSKRYEPANEKKITTQARLGRRTR